MDMHVIFTSRIGHLAMNTELFLRRRSLGLLDGTVFRIIDHFSGNYIANNQLYKMIKRKIEVKEITLNEYVRIAKNGNIDRGLLSGNSNEYWEFNNVRPQLDFLPYELVKGQNLLNKMGVFDKPYVCIHNRDSEYLNIKASNFNYSYHNYRDCSINNYLEAADWLTKQGIYVLRMGEIFSEKLMTDNPMIIDYAGKYRSDFGDIFLPSKAMFFLGNTAGIFLIATIFGVNSACANFVPFDMTPLLRNDIYIPKNSELKFCEQLKLNIDFFEKSEIKTLENTSEQILELSKEMYNSKFNSQEYNSDYVELQSKFRSLWNSNMRSYGYVCKVGKSFLEEKINNF